MSSEKQQENETGADMVLLNSPDPDELPIAILPVSLRAKNLMHSWGMDLISDGIMAPDNPMDLINSIPMHWTLGRITAPEKEVYVLQEVPLPQPLMVVH